MSRILDALRKGDADPRSSAAQRATEPQRVEAYPVEEPAHAGPAETHFDTAPAEPWLGEALPGLPEDFRRELAGLGLQVDSALAGRKPRVLLVTGSVEGEGATTVASCLARVLAQDPSKRVLLVDGNARRPGVGLFFGLQPVPGLAQALAGSVRPEDSLRAVERENLHVLATLPEEMSGAHLFPQPLVRALLSRLAATYDYVILDAPPVLEAPETIVLGGVVDTTLLVVRASSTKGGVVQRAVDTLAKAGVPVLGVVLNRRRFDIPEKIYRRI
jgi:capsular exopolysaccharide synthesis family protein